jgi:hypothetical protein
MIYIRGGNYHSLDDIAKICEVTRMAVILHAQKMGIEPLRLGRLWTRYHEDDAKKLIASFGKSAT